MTYTHLTQEERYQIHNLKRQGIHLSQIASELERSTSTISRELRRNASTRGTNLHWPKKVPQRDRDSVAMPASSIQSNGSSLSCICA